MTEQKRRRIAYLGPPGTFTEEAAILYAPQAEHIPCKSPGAVAQAVTSGMADEGIIAIENSLEGAVADNLDLLIHETHLSICYEVVLPIVQCLLGKPGTRMEDIQTISSHPQALGQCRRFIEQRLPKAQVKAALSTSAAVEQMLSEEHGAAIANRRAAQLYGAEILVEGVQDSASNETRFVVLAKADHEPTGHDKTSLCFAFTEDRAGILVGVMQAFSSRGISLAKIESRPSKESLGKYIFLVDLEGHRLDPPVKAALEEVVQQTDPHRFKIFGSYPRYNGRPS